MALSQIQCLDDNNVNPRINESKPDFLYCEDQRLALEALLQDGREAFLKFLEARGMRGFLSDPELETFSVTVEPYDPGSELFPEDAEEDEPPLSLHYWPELSDVSIPHMDLGWPDSEGYRGVTRATIYSQPPLDGQAHIKEVVRKMIAQAQKVIGVVMDVFTDVDIFRDLLDAGFKRRVSVYILLEHKTLPHFLSMCRRANMHAGHLKHLRVRCTEGSVFHTRSSTKVKGRMGHRFMFIDGDKAVSGTYSFTWMSSRLDKNLITVVTGQAVDAFDKIFRTLYGTSSSVDLRQVAKEPEPEPEPLPQPAAVAPPSAAVARKLYNPKYALALGNPSPTPSAGDNSPKKTLSPENSRSPDIPDNKTGRRRRGRATKDAVQEPPPIHPGLIDLEKASLITYLPTWPEPEPSKDVIGFINIRDANRPNQVHLQRSEMFGTSQAIRFSSPFSKPEETLPEVATPRQLTAKPGETNKVQPAQDKTKAQAAQLGTQTDVNKTKAEESKPNCPASGPKWDTAKTLNNEGKPHSNTPTDRDAGHNTTPHLSAHTPPKFSGEASPPITGTPSRTTNDPEPDSLPGSNAKLNQTRAVVYRRDTTQSSHLQDSNAVEHSQTKTHTDSHTRAVHTQPQNSAEITPKVRSPTVSPSSPSAIVSQPVTSTSLSVNNPVSITTSVTTSAGAPSSSISPPPTSATLTPPLPSSSPAPPVPKPRTIQLLINESGSGEKLPELSVIGALETRAAPQAVHNEPAVEEKKGPDTVPELQNDSGSKTEAQKDAENAGNIRDAPQHKQGGTAQDTKNNTAVRLLDDRAGMQSLAGTNLETQSDVLISGVPKAESVNIREIIPKDVEPEALTSLDCKVTPEKECEEAAQAGAKDTERLLTGCEFAKVQNETSKNVTQHKTLRASAPELQTISYGGLTPETKGVLDILESLKARKHTPGAAAHNPHISKGSAGDSTQTSPADTHVEQGLPNTVKHNPQSPSQELVTKSRESANTPKKSLRLYLSDVHTPDLRSQTPERESPLLAALVHTPTPEGILPSTLSPDSRTHSPRSITPDVRTSTPDGYVTPRPDSALSTASDEYYECSSSPLHEAVVDRVAYRNHSATGDHVGFTHNHSPTATTVATSPACINHNTHIATLESTDRNSSSSESQTLSGPASVSSVSSLLEERVKVRKEGTTNEENGREVDAKGSMAERRTEGDSQQTQRRGRDEAKRPADHFKQGKDLTETAEGNKEAQPQVLKRKSAPNQVTQRQSSNEGAERKRLSAGDLAAKRVSSEGEGPDKEKAVDKAATRPSGAVRKSSPKSSKETEGQKRLHTPPRPSRGQQPGSAGSSPSRPSRPPRSLSSNPALGPRPWVGRQPSQAESKALSNSHPLLDNTSPGRAPSRPSPPAAAGAVGLSPWRKQAEVSHGQQSLLTRQPAAPQGKPRAGQSPNRQSYPRSQASFLHSHANAVLNPHSSQNQTVSPREELSQEEGKASFGFTFSRLYSLKGLKDKMSKLPAQRGSTSSAAQSRKSTI